MAVALIMTAVDGGSVFSEDGTGIGPCSAFALGVRRWTWGEIFCSDVVTLGRIIQRGRDGRSCWLLCIYIYIFFENGSRLAFNSTALNLIYRTECLGVNGIELGSPRSPEFAFMRFE